jgi:hypothetical protein
MVNGTPILRMILIKTDEDMLFVFPMGEVLNNYLQFVEIHVIRVLIEHTPSPSREGK